MSAAARKLHGGGMAPSPSSFPEKVNGAPSSKSCGKSSVLRPIFPRQLPDMALEHAATIISAAFPGTSENAVCEIASHALGVSPNVIRSILRKETRNPSWPLLYAALHHIRDPWALPGIRDFVAGVLSK